MIPTMFKNMKKRNFNIPIELTLYNGLQDEVCTLLSMQTINNEFFI
jgi:hypothetical protein